MLYTNWWFVQSIDYLLNPRIAQNEMHKQQNMQFMDIDELKILDSSNIPHIVL